MQDITTPLIIHKIASYLDPKSLLRCACCCQALAYELHDYTSSITDWCNCKEVSSEYLSNLLMHRIHKIKHMCIEDRSDYGKFFFIRDSNTQLELPPNIMSCHIVIMTHDEKKVYDVVSHIVQTYDLQAISLDPYDYEYSRVISDKHIKLLENIKYVSLNNNMALTDDCLHHLRHAETIQIRGCKNILGVTIPRLLLDPSTKLYGILWSFGYGTQNRPFGDDLHHKWVIHQSSTFIHDFHMCHRSRNGHRFFVVPHSTRELDVCWVNEDGHIFIRNAQDVM